MLTDFEKQKIKEFFYFFENGFELAEGLAKTIGSKSNASFTFEEALNVICVHSTSLFSILSRKIISKDLIFKYLTKKAIPVPNQATKANLIDKVIEYWGTQTSTTESHYHFTQSPITQTELQPASLPAFNDSNCRVGLQQEIEEFPIHRMARQFAKWFFENLHQHTLQPSDFFQDVFVQMTLYENSNVTEDVVFTGNTDVHEQLFGIKTKYNIMFNLNISHEGVQGRMDPHGLVLILSCGTLHRPERCVGLFDTVFGLARDPFAENNWKVKNLKLVLRSQNVAGGYRLQDSESMQQLMYLPQTSDDF